MEAARAQLIQALDAVHNPGSEAQVRRSASDWLQTWQQSVDAWSVSNQLLHDPNLPSHLQFYCSQTLRVKASICSLVVLKFVWRMAAQMTPDIELWVFYRCRRILMRSQQRQSTS